MTIGRAPSSTRGVSPAGRRRGCQETASPRASTRAETASTSRATGRPTLLRPCRAGTAKLHCAACHA
eukprot:1967782-Pyramimonas_sp.AAC.1